MTIDKIKHYLSEPIFNHISGLNAEQLQAQKEALIRHIDFLKCHEPKFYAETQIKLEAEMQFINHRLP